MITTLMPNEIRDIALERFQALAFAKYNVGQAEHGGVITDRCLVDELEKEIIDAWFYIQALKLKLAAIKTEDK